MTTQPQSPDHYESLRTFVQKHILDTELEFNTIARPKSGTVKALLRDFTNRGWEVVSKSENDYFRELTSPGGNVILQMADGKIWRHSDETEYALKNKAVTREALEAANLPMPTGRAFNADELEAAKDYLPTLGGPAVVKPSSTGGSRGITVGITTADELEAAWPVATKHVRAGDSIIVEEQVSGLELRFYLVDGKTVAVLARMQGFVVGDGTHTFEELVDAAHTEHNRHFIYERHPFKPDWEFVAEQGFGPTSVLPAGQIVFVSRFTLPRIGGVTAEIGDQVAPSVKDLAERSVALYDDLEVAGVDVLIDDLSDPSTAHILELNAAPALDLHRFPGYGKPVDVYTYVVEYYDGKAQEVEGPRKSAATNDREQHGAPRTSDTPADSSATASDGVKGFFRRLFGR